MENLIGHCRNISEYIPIIGFYLQPAVGGRILPYHFWRQFAEIENVLAIKIAPFNRYQTLDVVRAICDAEREDDITLYTGNDDNIVLDLLTEYKCNSAKGQRSVRIKGGLLGHWAVWTRKAVELLKEIHLIVEKGLPVPAELLTKAMEITDSNAAVFDAANSFAGCIPGIHEVLKKQGLLSSVKCLNPDEVLSPGQLEEIERVQGSYPHLNDNEFVAENLEVWLRS
jgi:dihydrodipicolinate synthase/N-acetylneuraminate lyase